jgi:hypothetical protein
MHTATPALPASLRAGMGGGLLLSIRFEFFHGDALFNDQIEYPLANWDLCLREGPPGSSFSALPASLRARMGRGLMGVFLLWNQSFWKVIHVGMLFYLLQHVEHKRLLASANIRLNKAKVI